LKRDSPANFGPLVSLGGEIGLGGSESQDRGEGTFGGENQRKGINIWNFEKFLGGGSESSQRFDGKKVKVNGSQEIEVIKGNPGVIDANV
jgi:hypothetical protein